MSTNGRAKLLTPDEVRRVLQHIDKESRYPERDRVMVLLSVRAGLRAAEVAALRWRHVLTADGNEVAEVIDLPRVATKGARSARSVPVHAELREALEGLRLAWPDRAEPDMPVVFSERSSSGYTANGIAHRFLVVYGGASLTGASSHSGRRTVLTALARSCQRHGGSLVDVQRIAGHAYLSTTLGYVEPSAEAQRAMIDAL